MWAPLNVLEVDNSCSPDTINNILSFWLVWLMAWHRLSIMTLTGTVMANLNPAIWDKIVNWKSAYWFRPCNMQFMEFYLIFLSGWCGKF